MRKSILSALLFLLCASSALAAETAEAAGAGASHGVGITLLWIALILIIAKVASLVERLGQPAVLGELLAGIVIGNLALLGISFFEPLEADVYIRFLAELGVIILLFQVGLESSLDQMRKVGARATLVALIGVAVPFATGYYLGPYLFPDLEVGAYLFLGAALTATSVGITARVFSDLGKSDLTEAKIVLGAAVIDDVIGLVLLAVVSAIVTAGSVSMGTVAFLFAKALLFLAGSIVLGRLIAPYVGKALSRIHTGIGMKITLALSTCLLLAYAAHELGLAPIVGAFAAGLVLEHVHFKGFREPEVVEDIQRHTSDERVRAILRKHSHKHVEDLISPLALILVPIFFVLTGATVDLSTLFDLPVLLLALGITAIAIAGKVCSGLAAGSKARKWVVGWGMVPRGEVGLIFATIGKAAGVVNDTMYSVIVIMVVLTTLITPLVLNSLLKKPSRA